MEGVLRHNCGLVVAHSLHDAHSFIKSLKHRGREASGLAAIGDDRIDVIRWVGTPHEFDLVDLINMFPGHRYDIFMGHVRYATRGRKDQILEDAHPQVLGGKEEHRGNHVIFRDCDLAMVHNGQAEVNRHGDDGKRGTDTERLLYAYRELGERGLLEEIVGAYTIAVADRRKKGVMAIRDRTGIRPGVLGIKDGKHVIASEDIAIRRNGGQFVEDMTPGHVYYLSPAGRFEKERVIPPSLKECIFEGVYLAHEDTILNGISVRTIRRELGEVLAEEIPIEADFVTYIPRCPEIAARAYAENTGAEFLPVFYKPKSERAFMGSTAEERGQSIRRNLFLLPDIEEEIRGSRVVVIDDSIVRGNNAKYMRKLLESMGVEEAHLISYSPPIGIIEDGVKRGCRYGVDMPPSDNFIARDRSMEEISEEIGMPVHYMPREAFLRFHEKMGMNRDELCYFCMGGPEPFVQLQR